MVGSMLNPETEDVGNIICLEHVNLTIPDQSIATEFYLKVLGGTRDPYLMVGVENMWVNLGGQQFHLPTNEPQVLYGHIGLVTPNLDTLKTRLKSAGRGLADTQFSWSEDAGCIEVIGPWGNKFRCCEPDESSGDMMLGITYVEFLVERGNAECIGKFYRDVFGAPSTLSYGNELPAVRITVGVNQALVFQETHDAIPVYDGHHIAIYTSDFSKPYRFLKDRGLVTEEIQNHQFRFTDIVDTQTDRPVFKVEHEVRSMYHPMYGRYLVNRDPNQQLGRYIKGHDGFYP